MVVCTAANILGSIIFVLVVIGLFPSTVVAFVRFVAITFSFTLLVSVRFYKT